MNIKLTTTLLLAATLASVGCNSGSRSSKGGAATAAPATSGATTTPTTSSTTGATTSTTTGGTTTQPTAGTFSNGPDLVQARGQHSATVLGDGRVLVVGGTDGQGIIADSELFDPLTNTWDVVRNVAPTPADGLMLDATGTVPTARQLHAAQLLADGRVLIAGGLGVERLDAQGNPIFETMVTAYAFTPATNSFAAVGNLTAARGWHEAGIAGGRAAMIGGLDVNLNSLASADVFDATTNTFAGIGLLGFHTWGATVNLTTESLVIGGANVQAQQGGGFAVVGFPNPMTEVFNGTSVGAGPAITADVIFPAAGAMGNGNAFVAGGRVVNGQAFVSSTATEVFDAATGAFTPGPALNTARFGAVVARIGSTADQLVIGGLDDNGALLTSCEVFHAASNTIIGQATMAIPRSDFRAVTLQDGRILVTGGVDANNAGLAQTEFHTR